MMKKIIILIILYCFLPVSTVFADEASGFSITYENDVFRNTDKSYTNGVRFSWISKEEGLPQFIAPLVDTFLTPTSRQIPFFSQNGKKRISYALGQSMFTPENINSRVLQQNDRPYAGWLYGSIGLTSDTGKHLDYLELTLGIVGPASLAEQTQDFVHKHITGSPIAQGWDEHQLDNEPGLMLTYEHKWKNLLELSPFGLGIDLTPHAGFSVGNILTHAAVGGTLRLGYDLPSDYGPPRVRPAINGSDFFIPTKKIGGYLFVGTEGRAVGHNIFLDGNSFGSSHSVDKNHLIVDIQFGASLTYHTTRFAYTQVIRSKEYRTQDSGDRFGILTVSTKF